MENVYTLFKLMFRSPQALTFHVVPEECFPDTTVLGYSFFLKREHQGLIFPFFWKMQARSFPLIRRYPAKVYEETITTVLFRYCYNYASSGLPILSHKHQLRLFHCEKNKVHLTTGRLRRTSFFLRRFQEAIQLTGAGFLGANIGRNENGQIEVWIKG
jgi:hypothetical protein